jgi:hypothetical protein
MHVDTSIRFVAIGVVVSITAWLGLGCGDSKPAPSLPPNSPPGNVLVVGDSIAFQTAQGLGRVQAQHHLRIANGGVPGCGLVRGGETLELGSWVPGSQFCDTWPIRWERQVRRYQPEVVVLLTGFWDVFDRRLPDGQVLEFGSDEADEYVQGQLNEALDILTSGGARLLILSTPYFADDPRGGQPRNSRDDDRLNDMNDLFRDVAEEREDVEVVDLNDFLTPNGFRDSIDGESVRGDGIHLTPAGQRLVAAWLAPKLVGAVQEVRHGQAQLTNNR